MTRLSQNAVYLVNDACNLQHIIENIGKEPETQLVKDALYICNYAQKLLQEIKEDLEALESP